MANDGDETPTSGAQVANLVVALLFHVVLGLPWLAAVTGIAWLSGEGAALLWGGCGLALWGIGAVDAVRRIDRPGAVWGAVLKVWLWVLGGPLSLAIVGIQRLSKPPRAAAAPAAAQVEPEEPVNPALARRLDEVERRLRELGRELAEIRRVAETGEAEAAARRTSSSAGHTDPAASRAARAVVVGAGHRLGRPPRREGARVGRRRGDGARRRLLLRARGRPRLDRPRCAGRA